MTQYYGFSKFTILLGLFLSAGATAKTESGLASPNELTVSGDFLVSVKIGEQILRLRVDPGMPGTRVLNPDVAAHLALKPSKMWGHWDRIGPIIVKSSTDKTEVDYLPIRRKDRFAWSTYRVIENADGVIAPSALPYDQVTFSLAAARPGETLITLPLQSTGLLGWGGNATSLLVEQTEIRVIFRLDRDENVLVAPTGKLIADAFGGVLTGQIRPFSVRYGIERPVRLMVLDKPLLLGGRAISNPWIRVSDFGDATRIPDGEAPVVDPDEIVVQAENTQKKKKSFQLIALGRSFLAGCSSMTYDFKRKQIRLSCVPAASL